MIISDPLHTPYQNTTRSFTQQILRSSKYRTKFDHPNPFFDEEDSDGMQPASVAFRYRKFDLGDDITIVARTELHGLAKDRKKADTSKIVTNISGNKKKKKKVVNPLDVPEGDQYMTCYALNEYDPSYKEPTRPGTAINWREKLDNQSGAVLASELKNNSICLIIRMTTSLRPKEQSIRINKLTTSMKNPNLTWNLGHISIDPQLMMLAR